VINCKPKETVDQRKLLYEDSGVLWRDRVRRRRRRRRTFQRRHL